MKPENEKAWARSMALAMEVYQTGRAMPKEACGGLSRLIQQEAVAIPVHLAGARAGRARALACLTALEMELKLAAEAGCLKGIDLDRLTGRAGEVRSLLRRARKLP